MKFIYILSIVTGAIFFLLLLIFLCMWINTNRKNSAKIKELRDMYADKNSPKMDYDFAVYDEEVEKMIQKGETVEEGQLTIDDVIRDNGAVSVDDTVFASVEVENVEEITGNYNPDIHN